MHFLFLCIFAHELLHKQVMSDKAIVIEFYFADNSKFSYETYKVYRPGKERIPFAIGRTDALGRVVFIPDTEGVWTVVTQSETGHGAKVFVEVGKDLVAIENNNPMGFNIGRFLLGIFVIFIVFSLLFKRSQKQ